MSRPPAPTHHRPARLALAIALWACTAIATAQVTWTFDPAPSAGHVVTLDVAGLPGIAGLWLAVVHPGAPVGDHLDWAYAPAGAGGVRLRLPERSAPLEFRLYRDAPGGPELLARSETFVPQPLLATLSAPATVAAYSTFEVDGTGPGLAGDAVVLVDPATDGVPLDAAPTALGWPLRFDAPWPPGRYELRYVTGAEGLVLARVDVEVMTNEAGGDGADPCTARPDEASLLEAFEAEAARTVALARLADGLDDARYTAAGHVVGAEGVVDAAYQLRLTDPLTQASVIVEGTATARFAWSGCAWMLVDVRY